MDFEWDEANRLKHGISFERAIAIFEGWTYTITDDRFDYGEVRKLSIGGVDKTLVVAVVHTDRSGCIRLISARRASAKERHTYERALQSRTDQ